MQTCAEALLVNFTAANRRLKFYCLKFLLFIISSIQYFKKKIGKVKIENTQNMHVVSKGLKFELTCSNHKHML